jgi:hypothetical protein
MTDYTKLIEVLRWCGGKHNGWCVDETYKCPLWSKDRRDKDMLGDYCKEELMTNAADALESAEKRIAELMTKEGEWKVRTTVHPSITCSECGVEIPLVAGWRMDAHTNYCPNCGARMKGENDEQAWKHFETLSVTKGTSQLSDLGH